MKSLETAVAWKILCFFLEPRQKPGGERVESSFHVQGLARRLSISPGSASIICRQLLKEGMLEREMRGNGAYYSLNSTHPSAKTFQKALLVQKALEAGLPKDERIEAIAFYGNANQLPLKLLVLTNLRPPYCQRLLEPFFKRFQVPVSLKVITTTEFSALAESKDNEFMQIIASYSELKGKAIEDIGSRPGE